MADLRRPHLAHFLIVAACSSTDPSGGASALQGVDALEQLDCNGDCYEQNIAGAALAQGSVWVTRSKLLTQCDGNCVISSASAALALADFDDAGTAAFLASTPTFKQPMSSGVGVTPDGLTTFFAYGDPQAGQMVFDATTNGSDAGHATAVTAGRIVGVIPDGRSAVFAVANPPQQSNSWTNGSDDGQYSGGGGGADNVDGMLYRVNFDDGGVTPLATSFDLQGSIHLVASDATNVIWIGGGSLWSAPRDLSSPPQMVAPVDDASACSNGNCTFSLPFGLAVANGVIAWEVMSGTSACNGGPCVFTPTKCQIRTVSKILYESNTACMGLAIDDTDAYFGIAEEKTTQECCNNDDGGILTHTYLTTTGIGRVPLTAVSASSPQATLAWADTTRFYGPRRLFVDSDWVYGVDPRYVLRVAKNAFK